MTIVDFLNFDSLNSNYNKSSQYSTFSIVDNGLPNQLPHSFNSNFSLPNTKQNVSKIYLRSIEIPLSFNNIRASSNLTSITLATTLTGSNYIGLYNVDLIDKNYSSITILLADINSAFLTKYPTVNIIFGLNSFNIIQITSTSSGIFTNNIHILNSNLAYLLGFRNFRNTLATRLITAVSPYNLNLDNYISMYLTNVSSNSTNANQSLCSFKIPLNSVNGVVYFSAESSSYQQYINTDANLILQNLNIVFYDRFGLSLHSNNSDYSFTLGFETIV